MLNKNYYRKTIRGADEDVGYKKDKAVADIMKIKPVKVIKLGL